MFRKKYIVNLKCSTENQQKLKKLHFSFVGKFTEPFFWKNDSNKVNFPIFFYRLAFCQILVQALLFPKDSSLCRREKKIIK
jgi:hypothetical protein